MSNNKRPTTSVVTKAAPKVQKKSPGDVKLNQQPLRTITYLDKSEKLTLQQITWLLEKGYPIYEMPIAVRITVDSSSVHCGKPALYMNGKFASHVESKTDIKPFEAWKIQGNDQSKVQIVAYTARLKSLEEMVDLNNQRVFIMMKKMDEILDIIRPKTDDEVFFENENEEQSQIQPEELEDGTQEL